jgi:hypothetical protein
LTRNDIDVNAVRDPLEDINIRIVVVYDTLIPAHCEVFYTTSAPTGEPWPNPAFSAVSRASNPHADCATPAGSWPATCRVATLNRFHTLMVPMAMSRAARPASS